MDWKNIDEVLITIAFCILGVVFIHSCTKITSQDRFNDCIKAKAINCEAILK